MEVVIAVALVALLTSLALPAWRDAVTRSRRAVALQALTRIAADQQVFRLAQGRYASAAELSVPQPDGLGHRAPRDYTTELRDHTSGFTVVAQVRPGGRQQDDTACWVFTLDASGRRQALTQVGDDNTERCWPR